jgi:hypothetical protein
MSLHKQKRGNTWIEKVENCLGYKKYHFFIFSAVVRVM